MRYKLFAFVMAFFYLLSPVFAYAEAGGGQSDGADSSSAKASPKEEGILTETDRGTSIASPASEGLDLVAEGAVLMDAATGTVLYAKNPEERFYPASTTKTMTALVALENSSLSDKLTYNGATLNAIEQDSSRVGVEADETMTMEDALYCVMLASGNDAAAGVAEHIGGSVDEFVGMMNDKAQELGCTNTHFMNPHGLHNEQHYTCAKDLALIVRAAVQNPDFCKIASSKTYTVPKTNKSAPRELWNHHKMLLPASEHHYEGVAEGKTGFTSDAWNTLITTAQKGDMKLIATILRCQGAAASYNDTARLFNYGFENYHAIHPLADFDLKKAEEYSDLSVGEISNLEKLEPVYNKNYSILAPAEITAEEIGISITNDGQEQGIWGAIHFSYQGEEVGKANIYYNENSDFAAIMTENVSTKAKLISKLPYILIGTIAFLVLFILYLIVSIIKKK